MGDVVGDGALAHVGAAPSDGPSVPLAPPAPPPSAQSIRVVLRVRPSKRPSGFFSAPPDAPTTLHFAVPVDVQRDVANAAGASHEYRFDRIFGGDASQEDVFGAVALEAVDSALAGINSTVFAYGQTGSGKTFTITGGAERYSDRGLIPRAIQRVFSSIRASAGRASYTVRVTYLELYMENAYDLLDPSQETKVLEELPRVTLLEDDEGVVHLRGLSAHVVSSEEEALNLLFLGDTNRAIAETPMNLASSRSHCVFTIAIEGRDLEGGTPGVVRRSKLHLVDLAGSERTGKTHASGALFREATHINKSLHYLELVIVALHEVRRGVRTHVPYRNSLMTSLLRDSLGGNCKTTMVATINPEAEHTDESISTCRFAQRAARVQNVASVNESMDPAVLVRQLKARVSALEAEAALRAQAAKEEDGAPAVTALSDEDRAAIVTSTRAWIDAPSDAPPDFGRPVSLERIRVMVLALKVAALEARAPVPTSQAAPSSPIAVLPQATDGSAVANANANRDGHADEGGGGDSALLAALREEVKRLRAHALQRDSEVKALLGVIKTSSDNAQRVTGVFSRDVLGAEGAAQRGIAAKPVPPRPPPAIVLCNGTRVTLADLGDRDGMLSLFRDHVAPASGRAAAEENKAALRSMYEEAKTTAARVNEARSELSRIKSEVERHRVEASMAAIASGAKSAGPDAHEASLLASLEEEKTAYRSGFEALRRLKLEIEGVQRILESGRTRLLADFEAWHNDCCAKLTAEVAAGAAAAPRVGSSSVDTSFASIGSVGSGCSAASDGASLLGGLSASRAATKVPPRTSVSAPPAGGGGHDTTEADIAAFYALKRAK